MTVEESVELGSSHFILYNVREGSKFNGSSLEELVNKIMDCGGEFTLSDGRKININGATKILNNFYYFSNIDDFSIVFGFFKYKIKDDISYIIFRNYMDELRLDVNISDEFSSEDKIILNLLKLFVMQEIKPIPVIETGLHIENVE